MRGNGVGKSHTKEFTEVAPLYQVATGMKGDNSSTRIDYVAIPLKIERPELTVLRESHR